MTRPLLLPALVALSLAACSPAPTSAEPSAPTPAAAAAPAPVATPATPAPAQAAPAPANAPAPTPAAPTDPAAASTSSIAGAIRNGNRTPPALRVCAHPVDGGTPTCIETPAGMTSYRIGVGAGRYVISGQALDDPEMTFAHAERIRCIRAPCPPDTAIEVGVAEGQTRSGIDLSVGAALPPG